MQRALALGVALTFALVSTATSQENIFAGRPAFSLGDQPAQSWAACGQLRAMADGLPDDTEMRIDLSVVGKLLLVKSDGVLWYLGMCAPPGLRVLCVAYQSNGMQVGDTVFMKGGYRRTGPDHILLDPCLANWPEKGETPPSGN